MALKRKKKTHPTTQQNISPKPSSPDVVHTVQVKLSTIWTTILITKYPFSTKIIHINSVPQKNHSTYLSRILQAYFPQSFHFHSEVSQAIGKYTVVNLFNFLKQKVTCNYLFCNATTLLISAFIFFSLIFVYLPPFKYQLLLLKTASNHHELGNFKFAASSQLGKVCILTASESARNFVPPYQNSFFFKLKTFHGCNFTSSCITSQSLP